MLSCNTAISFIACVHGFESDSEILCDNFLVKELDVEAKYFSLSICPRLATISPFFLAKDECFAPPTHQPRVSKRSWKKFHFRSGEQRSDIATLSTLVDYTSERSSSKAGYYCILRQKCEATNDSETRQVFDENETSNVHSKEFFQSLEREQEIDVKVMTTLPFVWILLKCANQPILLHLKALCLR